VSYWGWKWATSWEKRRKKGTAPRFPKRGGGKRQLGSEEKKRGKSMKLNKNILRERKKLGDKK